MPKIVCIDRDGAERIVDAGLGESVIVRPSAPT